MSPRTYEYTASGRHQAYPRGSRVELVQWAPSEIINDHTIVPKGTQGTVTGIDDAGTLWMRWDNGASLGVTVHDRIKLIALPKEDD